MLSVLLEKKSLQRSRIKDQSGQGTVEYVLILVITVGIILGLMNQFYKPFNAFLNNYMGTYLQCLLDVGELPALGWDQNEGICNEEFEPFSLAGGRPPTQRPPGERQPREDLERNPTTPPGSSSSSSGGNTTSNGRRPPGSSIRLGGNGTGADGAGQESDKVQKIPVELEDTRYFRVSRATGQQTDSRGRQSRAVGIAGLLDSEKKQLEREQQRIRKSGSVEDFGPEGKPKKLRVKAPERKVAAADQSADEWTFGKFIRLALILLIIVAIVLFLGGQALQISKSMDE